MTNHANPIVYTELHTQDPARARAFYTELFGWKSVEEPTPAGPYTAFEGQLVGLTGSRIPGVPVAWVPYIHTDDVVATTKRAKALGAEVLREDIAIPDGRFSVVRDPTGGVIGFFQPTRKE